MLRYQIIRILQIAVLFLLIGRAWEHLFWEVPYQYLFRPEWGFTPWFVAKTTVVLGWFYLLGAFLVLTLDSRDRKQGYLLVFHSAALLLLAQMFRSDNACEWPTFFLYVSQFASPFLYYLLLFTNTPITRVMGLLKTSLMLTLGGYAWYALGWHYGQKTEWLNALVEWVGLSNNTASYVLAGVGILELLLIALLWVKPLQRIAFVGILFWGVFLMIASVGLFFFLHPEWTSALRSAWELFCLLPNAALSFALWRYVEVKKKEEEFL